MAEQAASATTSQGQCPMDHQKMQNGKAPNQEGGGGWASLLPSWLSSSNTQQSNLIKEPSSQQPQQRRAGECPVDHSKFVASVEEAAKHPQLPQFADQATPLSTRRVVSTIPRAAPNAEAIAESATTEAPKTTPGCAMSAATNASASASGSGPSHQPSSDAANWVYPSEQQFYNAMRRKGYDAPSADTSMAHIIQIHNAVNERTWRHVLQWEQTLYPSSSSTGGSSSGGLKLVRFMGDPKKVSPRAWLYSNVLGYKPPFDRHDWFIDRGDGTERRYVIDFYDGSSPSPSDHQTKGVVPGAPVNMYVDVRPAIDDFPSLKDRIEMSIRQSLPGIFHIADVRMGSNTPSSNDTSKDDNATSSTPLGTSAAKGTNK
jgi:cytochrome c heme-lyase